MPQRRLDIGVIVAIAWLAAALGVSLVFGPRLGLRGWIWLGLHHVVCAIACAHELRRGWRRRKLAGTAPTDEA